MRKRFDDENDDFKDDVFRDDDEDEDEDSGGMLVDKNWLNHQEKALASRISCNLMTKAKLICERELFWRFRSDEYKLKKIARAYFFLLKLVTLDTKEPEKQENKKG